MAHKAIEAGGDGTEAAIKQLAATERRAHHPWFEWLEQKNDATTPYKQSSIFHRAIWGGFEANLGKHRRGPPKQKS